MILSLVTLFEEVHLLFEASAIFKEFLLPDYETAAGMVRMASANRKPGFVGSTARPSSTLQITDKTAWANAHRRVRLSLRVNLFVNCLSRLSIVEWEINSSGISFGLRNAAPISYSNSPTTPFGSIANQPRLESNKTL